MRISLRTFRTAIPAGVNNAASRSAASRPEAFWRKVPSSALSSAAQRLVARHPEVAAQARAVRRAGQPGRVIGVDHGGASRLAPGRQQGAGAVFVFTGNGYGQQPPTLLTQAHNGGVNEAGDLLNIAESSTWVGFSGPAGLYAYGMEWDASDNTILVGDYWNYRVQRFSITGTHLATCETCGGRARAIR